MLTKKKNTDPKFKLNDKSEPDPDPKKKPQVLDPQHWKKEKNIKKHIFKE